MNLQQLKYVRAVVEEGSFVAAAARCAVTQPTLSNGIAQLEAEIGHRIFNRTTRSVALTSCGEGLLPAIVETLNAYDRLREMTKRIGKGGMTIHAGISPVVGIRAAEETLEAFRTKRPDVGVVYREGNVSDLCDQLKREQLDIVIAPFDERSARAGEYVLQYLSSEPLLFLPRGGDAQRWSDVKEVRIHDISGESFVLVPNVCGLTQVTKQLFHVSSATLNRYPGEASSYAVVQEWTELGLGCGILPASKIDEDARNRAIPIVDDTEAVRIRYYALGKPNTVSPALFSELWDQLRPPEPTTDASQVHAEIYDWSV
jgi:DNA-binding transcriptional LysR family regulator